MAGHGGDGFMKFQDQEELTSSQLADALAAMHAQARCLLRITCSALVALDRHILSSLVLNLWAASRVCVGEGTSTGKQKADQRRPWRRAATGSC